MTQPTIKIKPVASPGDQDVARTLQKACLPWDDTLDPKTDGLWLLARTPSGIAIGYSGSYLSAENNAIVIAHQGVLASHRGLGLQARMIRETCKIAIKRGVPEVWSYVSTPNVASCNSFVSAGFRMWRPEHWLGESVSPSQTEWVYWRKKVIQ